MVKVSLELALEKDIGIPVRDVLFTFRNKVKNLSDQRLTNVVVAELVFGASQELRLTAIGSPFGRSMSHGFVPTLDAVEWASSFEVAMPRGGQLVGFSRLQDVTSEGREQPASLGPGESMVYDMRFSGFRGGEEVQSVLFCSEAPKGIASRQYLIDVRLARTPDSLDERTTQFRLDGAQYHLAVLSEIYTSGALDSDLASMVQGLPCDQAARLKHDAMRFQWHLAAFFFELIAAFDSFLVEVNFRYRLMISLGDIRWNYVINEIGTQHKKDEFIVWLQQQYEAGWFREVRDYRNHITHRGLLRFYRLMKLTGGREFHLLLGPDYGERRLEPVTIQCSRYMGEMMVLLGDAERRIREIGNRFP